MKIKLLFYCCILLVCFGCKSYKTKYPYSLEDLRPELREDLDKIIQTGVAGSYGSERLEDNCSIDDLHKMFKCEHPLIRAFAFNSLLEKNSNNIKELLLSALDDTSIISVSRGEWGIPRMYCAEYYIDEYIDTRFEKEYVVPISKLEAINKVRKGLLDTILQKAPYLKNSYQLIQEIDTIPEKYYNQVLNMAKKATLERIRDNGENLLSYDGQKLSDAIYALSKFKKTKDISFIKENLRPYSPYCWKIIENNPDTEYFSLIEEFYESLKRTKEISPIQFQITMYGKRNYYIESYENFLKAIAVYKSLQSSKILKNIVDLELLPYSLSEEGEYSAYKVKIYDILKENECKEYLPLINKLKPFCEPILNKNKRFLTL